MNRNEFDDFRLISQKHQLRGMTLVEALLVMIITVILILALFWLIVAARGLYVSSTARAADRQELQAIEWSIADELKASSVGFITNAAPPNPTIPGSVSAIGFLSAFDNKGVFQVEPATGGPKWQKQVIYFIPDASTNKDETTYLIRKEKYGTFTAAPSTADMQAFFYDERNGPNSRLLKTKVLSTNMAPILPSKPDLPLPLTLTIDIAKKSATMTLTLLKRNDAGRLDEQSHNLTILLYN